MSNMCETESLGLFAKLPSICHLKIFSLAFSPFGSLIAIESHGCVQLCVHMYVCSCGAQILLTLFFETECLTDVELVTEVRVDDH